MAKRFGGREALKSRGKRARNEPLLGGGQVRVVPGVAVVVQFYPWFKFSFLLFQAHYHVIIIHYHTQKQKKRNLNQG